MPKRFYAWASVIVDGRVVATDYAPDAGWLHPSSKAPPIAGEVASPGPDEVAPPIDSLEEAIAAVVLIDSRLNGFQASDTHVPGASSWLEAEARGDGWDLTFVCGPETSLAQDTVRGLPGRWLQTRLRQGPRLAGRDRRRALRVAGGRGGRRMSMSIGYP